MPYTTVAPGNPVTSAWANANVRDQVVTPFATASARTSAITAPVEGMVAYRSDAKALDVYDGTSWRQWLGIIAWGNRATSSSTTTTEIGVLRLDSISLAAGRAYRIWTNPLFLLSTVSNDVIAARLRISTVGTAGTASTQLGNSLQLKTDSAQPPSGALVALYQPGASAVTLSVILTVGRASGTGNASIFGTSDLIVEDVGPALTDAGVDI